MCSANIARVKLCSGIRASLLTAVKRTRRSLSIMQRSSHGKSIENEAWFVRPSNAAMTVETFTVAPYEILQDAETSIWTVFFVTDCNRSSSLAGFKVDMDQNKFENFMAAEAFCGNISSHSGMCYVVASSGGMQSGVGSVRLAEMVSRPTSLMMPGRYKMSPERPAVDGKVTFRLAGDRQGPSVSLYLPGGLIDWVTGPKPSGTCNLEVSLGNRVVLTFSPGRWRRHDGFSKSWSSRAIYNRNVRKYEWSPWTEVQSPRRA